MDIMSLSLNAYGCFFSLFPALSVCADTRVGNAIGRGAVEDAMRAMRVAVLLALPTATAVSMVGMGNRWVNHVGLLKLDEMSRG